MDFFDQYPRFYETNNTLGGAPRMNVRYRGLIARNLEHIVGKRILDLASHDGRWSFSAMEAGAESIIGIEGRKQLVMNARYNLLHYKIDPDRYCFLCADIFDAIGTIATPIDTIFCFGYLYHTTRHLELFQRMEDMKPETIILDTMVDLSEGPFCRVFLENTDDHGNAVPDRTTRDKMHMVAWPTREVVHLLADYIGYDSEELDWSDLADGIRDYTDGDRTTFVLKRR